MTTRAIKPRATSSLAVAPVTFTDLTAPIVVGLEPRQLRDFVAKHRVPHLRDGKRLIVRVDTFLAAFDRLATMPEGALAIATDDDRPITADGVLRSLGLRRVGGATTR